MPDATDGRTPAARTAELLHGMRGAIASLRAATETLQGYPHAERAVRDRLLGVLAAETGRLQEQLRDLELGLESATLAVTGSRLAVAARDLVRRLATTLATSGLDCQLAQDAAEEARASVRVDLDALAQAAGGFFTGLRRQCPVGACTLHWTMHERHLLIDVRWSPNPGDIPRLLDWQGAALGAGATDRVSGQLRAVAREHGGEAWFALDRDGSTAHVRLLLPGSESSAG